VEYDEEGIFSIWIMDTFVHILSSRKEMCKSELYKGLIIYENDKGSRFSTRYYTAVNPNKIDKNGKAYHVHASSPQLIRKIADCYDMLRKYGRADCYKRAVKNRAMRLDGYYILSK
jgi:hypothetical protein